jgi:methylase of polypeptide subunit release factors
MGCGGGVLSQVAVELFRSVGVRNMYHNAKVHVTAIDNNDRAVALARKNLQCYDNVIVSKSDLFSSLDSVISTTNDATSNNADQYKAQAHRCYDLILFNPPWLPLPARAANSLDTAVYDEDYRVLRRFLSQARDRLTTHGQVWVLVSDLPIRLGLLSQTAFRALLEAESGLRVLERVESRGGSYNGGYHAEGTGTELDAVRSAEKIVLYRLGKA